MKLHGPVRRVFLNSFGLALTFACLFFAATYVNEHGQELKNLGASVSSAEIITLTNGNRIAARLPSLATNPLLTQAAQLKADDMAARSYYAHVSPDGKSPLYWLDTVGYTYINAGENLVIDRTSSEQVVSAWMLSTDHRENILRPQFTEVGVGTAEGEYKGLRTIYVVEEFGTPTPKVVAKPAVVKAIATSTPDVTPVLPKKEAALIPGIPFEIKTFVPKKPLVTAPTTRQNQNTFQDIIRVPNVLVAESTTTPQVATTSEVIVTPLKAVSESKPVLLPSSTEPVKEVRSASYAPEAFYKNNTAWLQEIFHTLKVGFLSLY